MRIKVLSKNREVYIESCRREDYGQEKNLLEILRENSVSIPNFCHGNGTCGKCKVRVRKGYLPVTEADRRKLSDQELQQGIRLACKVCKLETEELWIEILDESEEDIAVEGIDKQTNENDCKNFYQRNGNEESKDKRTVREKSGEANHFIAIDIGTTTIAMALVNTETGKVCDIYTSLNHQRKYGADVISRIKAANEGKLEELKRLIEEDLWKGIFRFISEDINLIRVVIAGNTTMIHMLMGYSCESLGKYPFHSEHLEQIECRLEECISFDMNQNSLIKECVCKLDNFENNSAVYDENGIILKYKKIPATILPGISAFVGGDITACILGCPGFETEEICLLVDLGTNGEMVLGNSEKLMATSTAAGPAFEGGNIVDGTAAISGSIDKVKIQNQKAVVKTIKNEMPPVGICGTGLVSAIAELKKSKLMDNDGNLKYPYTKIGFSLWTQENGERIAVYQKDIREFQMAKSAVRAGIEILMEEYGCEAKDVKHVYLAGGFGTKLSEEDVLKVGIFPEAWRGKIVSIGNGVLQGAIRVGKEKIDNVKKNIRTISLAEHKSFQERYLKYMNF